MRLLEIETTFTKDIDQHLINQLLQSIKEKQEEIDSLSVVDSSPNYMKTYAALEAIANVLKNYKKALENPRLMDKSYFAFSFDHSEEDFPQAAIHGYLDNSVLEIKWVGNVDESGLGKKLIDHIIARAKKDGAKKVKLIAKWESDDYYKRHGFAEIPGTKGLFTGSKFEKKL